MSTTTACSSRSFSEARSSAARASSSIAPSADGPGEGDGPERPPPDLDEALRRRPEEDGLGSVRRDLAGRESEDRGARRGGHEAPEDRLDLDGAVGGQIDPPGEDDLVEPTPTHRPCRPGDRRFPRPTIRPPGDEPERRKAGSAGSVAVVAGSVRDRIDRRHPAPLPHPDAIDG